MAKPETMKLTIRLSKKTYVIGIPAIPARKAKYTEL